MRLPLRWIGILHGRIRANLAASGGIHRGSDAIKMLLAGADVTMLCSVLLRHGIEDIAWEGSCRSGWKESARVYRRIQRR
jgi:dihydroorotate dehydrogenase (fumarate)